MCDIGQVLKGVLAATPIGISPGSLKDLRLSALARVVSVVRTSSSLVTHTT